MKNEINIITDASFCFKTKIATFGFNCSSNHGTLSGSRALNQSITDSFSAEFNAIKETLDIARLNGFLSNTAVLVLQSDNKGVICTINGATKARHDVAEIVQYIYALINEFNLRLLCKHITGHVSHLSASPIQRLQNQCDLLARGHLNLIRSAREAHKEIQK